MKRTRVSARLYLLDAAATISVIDVRLESRCFFHLAPAYLYDQRNSDNGVAHWTFFQSTQTTSSRATTSTASRPRRPAQLTLAIRPRARELLPLIISTASLRQTTRVTRAIRTPSPARIIVKPKARVATTRAAMTPLGEPTTAAAVAITMEEVVTEVETAEAAEVVEVDITGAAREELAVEDMVVVRTL